MSKKKRENLFLKQPPPDEEDIIESIKVEHLASWKKVAFKGIGVGLLMFICTIVILIIMNILNFLGFSEELLDMVLIIEAILMLVLSTISIWFGPSPTIAEIKSSFYKRRIKPQSTSESLRIGIQRIISAIVLLVL